MPSTMSGKAMKPENCWPCACWMTLTARHPLKKPLSQLFPRRMTEHLDDPRRAGTPEVFEHPRVLRPEGTLDDARDTVGQEPAQAQDEQLVAGLTQRPGPFPVMAAQAVEERLLEVILAEGWDPQVAGQPARETAFARSGRSADNHQQRLLAVAHIHYWRYPRARSFSIVP